MGMLRDLALPLLFHRDRRQDQRVDRAENHHRSKAGDHTVPLSFALVRFYIFVGLLHKILLHCRNHQPF